MAAPGYVVNNLMGGSAQNLTTTPGVTIARTLAAASNPKRHYIWEIEGSQSGPPNATDCSVEWWLAYCGAAGAGTTTAATPLPTAGFLAAGSIDIATTTAGINYTVEPTTYVVADTFWARACNQRGTVSWQAAPGGEIYMPALASVGPGLRAYSATYASTALGKLAFSEI